MAAVVHGYSSHLFSLKSECSTCIGLGFFVSSFGFFDASNLNRILEKFCLRMTLKGLCSLWKRLPLDKLKDGGTSPRTEVRSGSFTSCLHHRFPVRSNSGYKCNGVFLQSIIFSAKQKIDEWADHQVNQDPRVGGVLNEWPTAHRSGDTELY